jgi:hypothetical protein
MDGLGDMRTIPGVPRYRRKLIDTRVRDVLWPEAPEAFDRNPKGDPKRMWVKDREVRAAVRPRIAGQARPLHGKHDPNNGWL